MPDNAILRVSIKLLLPFIFIFAFYVQFHGDYGPGGGFQAGTIFAAGVIVYALVFGVAAAQKMFSPQLIHVLIPLGLLLYAGTGVLCLLLGGNFLDYNVLAHDPSHGQHYGILAIEAGVGITVAAVVIRIFYAVAERPPMDQSIDNQSIHDQSIDDRSTDNKTGHQAQKTADRPQDL